MQKYWVKIFFFVTLIVLMPALAHAQKIDVEGGHVWKHAPDMEIGDLLNRCQKNYDLERASAFHSAAIMRDIIQKAENKLRYRVKDGQRLVWTFKKRGSGYGVECATSQILTCDDARVVLIEPRGRSHMATLLTAYPSNCRVDQMKRPSVQKQTMPKTTEERRSPQTPKEEDKPSFWLLFAEELIQQLF